MTFASVKLPDTVQFTSQCNQSFLIAIVASRAGIAPGSTRTATKYTKKDNNGQGPIFKKGTDPLFCFFVKSAFRIWTDAVICNVWLSVPLPLLRNGWQVSALSCALSPGPWYQGPNSLCPAVPTWSGSAGRSRVQLHRLAHLVLQRN